MWHVTPWVYQPAGLRISYPHTTYKTLLLRWCVTAVLGVPVAPFGPPASDPVFTVKDLTIAAWFPPCSLSGSWDSWASAGSSPSSTSQASLLSLDLPRPCPLQQALDFAEGLVVEEAPDRLLGSLAQQSLAAWPLDSPPLTRSSGHPTQPLRWCWVCLDFAPSHGIVSADLRGDFLVSNQIRPWCILRGRGCWSRHPLPPVHSFADCLAGGCQQNPFWLNDYDANICLRSSRHHHAGGFPDDIRWIFGYFSLVRWLRFGISTI